MKFAFKNDSTSVLCNKFPFVIGSNSSADILFPSLKSEHIKIIEKEGDLIAFNEANDPFASINGAPFRKKKLSINDIIEIGAEIRLKFEVVNEVVVKKDPKPITINDVEDDHEPPPPPTRPLGKIAGLNPEGTGKGLKFTCTILGMVLILLAFIGSALYTKAAESTDLEEVTAAEGVADIAMAFIYAQVHNIKPKKHNWSDPEFIKNNLSAVITHECPALSKIDAHGEFSNAPYLLRTYTSSDFSHFVIIAQPNPSVWQWLIPKKTIVVDSHMMELRKIEDVRMLNRLLVNSDSLDEFNSKEVINLIEKGELIPLADLAYKLDNQGFTPPKALGLMHPGAQNRIYNAPRYYQFGESIIKRALTFGLIPENMPERYRLKQEMEVLGQFPDMVLYTSHGMEMAMQTRRALNSVIPEASFILGYLKFNSKGFLVSSNLIMDQEVASAQETHVEYVEEVTSQELLDIQGILAQVFHQLEDLKVEEKKSLPKRLQRLLKNREEALSPITQKIIIILNSQLHSPANQDLQPLLKEYKRIVKQQDAAITQGITSLYKEFVALPFNEFIETVQATGLGNWISF